MPLAQLAEPWPKMELVQLETEVRGGEITALKLTDLMSPQGSSISARGPRVCHVEFTRITAIVYKSETL